MCNTNDYHGKGGKNGWKVTNYHQSGRSSTKTSRHTWTKEIAQEMIRTKNEETEVTAIKQNKF